MSVADTYNEVGEELSRYENRLKAENFSDYSMEAVDCERTELEILWAKYKSAYEEHASASKEKKKIHLLHNQYHKTYIRCVNIIAKVRKNVQESDAQTNVAQKSSELSIHVPPCDTGVFAGDYASWPTFRDLFTAIFINNSKLTAVEKLFYLFQKTEGEAREINRNVALTAENFEIAWSNLRRQYENRRILVNSQLRLLFNMVPCQQDSFQEIKRLQRDISNCMSVLKLSQINIESWDPIFVYLCSAKLSKDTLNLWEQSIQDKTELPKWSDLDRFLTGRFHALESVSDILAPADQWGVKAQPIVRSSHQTMSKVKRSKSHHSKSDVVQCKLCKESHLISSCYKFLNMDRKNRASILRKFKYCFNCLKIGHMYANCPGPNGCSKCNGKHHTLLHREDVCKGQGQEGSAGRTNPGLGTSTRNDNIQSTSMASDLGSVQVHHIQGSRNVMLATAWVNIVHLGSMYAVRALIDPCSDESFVSEKIQTLLKLPTVPISAEVSGLGGGLVSRSNKMARFQISPRAGRGSSLPVEALVVKAVTGSIPTHSVCLPKGMVLPELEYADPSFYQSGKVDLLLGGDLYPMILMSGVKHGIFESLVAQQTIFGWIVTGPTNGHERSRISVNTYFTKVSLDEQLSRFWEIEEVSRKRFLSEDDKKCEEIYCASTVRRPDGRYAVNLPFKLEPFELQSNRYIALQQFLRNERGLMRDPERKQLYDDVLREYIELGHMVRAKEQREGPHYYLPHHGILKPDNTTTKLRVVFNASSRSMNGKSLNDLLYVGPILQADLVMLVLKWRFFRFVFGADISKMYRQILVNPDHTRFQKILFRESTEDHVGDFELKTVTFGVTCAPYLAMRTLLRLADDEEDRFPIGAQCLRECLYVDDALVGANTVEEGRVAQRQLIDILQSAGFELRKWTANDTGLLADIPPEHLLSSSFRCLDDKSIVKTLGVRWNASGDYFYFVTEKMYMKDKYTKREVLALISRLFDPAGWLAPVIVTAKILMQQMWLDRIDWDDEIKPTTLQRWKGFLSRYNEIDCIKIPRWVGYSPACDVEYHGFCDSSESAYAAAVYVRVAIEDQIFSNLLVAKTKVAPIKKLSIPRLELCGAVLLAELVEGVISQMKITAASRYLWSDSTIVLAWLKKPPCVWKTFVANRVALILEKVGNISWSHVSTDCNPADLATRGTHPSDLKQNSLWWHGPDWLRSERCFWPQTKDTWETTQESRRVQAYVARSGQDIDILERFSTLPRAIRVLAYVFRFFNRVRARKDSSVMAATSKLTAQEVTFVRSRLFLLAQRRSFPDEYMKLSKKQFVASNSPLLSLTPFLDQKGIIRANGRLGATTSLTYNERHPIILSHTCRLAKLYVDFIHRLTLHGGHRLVLNTIRLECWILKAKTLIKSHIRNCKECVLYRKQCLGQIMSVLPDTRITCNRPFTNTGVDFAGPFELKSFAGRRCKITKGYVCLFVCFSTKAIHLEAVSDLSTPAFLAAFVRFVSRRGCPNRMYSDNGRNFVGAARKLNSELQLHVKELKDEALNKYGHQQLSWHFIPPGAPHMGGLWEAGVKSTKMHLKKISGQTRYTFEEFATVLAAIEACLNSRPLTALSSDAEDLSALTPGHFLIGGPILTPAEPEETSSPESLINRWRKVKATQTEFCRRWKKEYLFELNKRNKWKVPQVDLTVGDLVVLRHEPVCPTEWKLGRVIKVYPGPDGQVRVAEVKTQTGIVTRPIHKMVLLPRGPQL
ncbi:uncharacterized protein LOC142231024 [Haematobia irritans]|uniref:uncharacterized protein LOC142231024 n=1 Tax=Haematobia irritans TaxID=7368 RepID=UPI003F501653